MAFDFTHLPGGGGSTGPLVTGLDLLVEIPACYPGLELFACFRAVVDIFLLVFDLFGLSIFQGRAPLGKDSATDDVALFFIPASNPVVSLWGMGVRILEAQGIPLSTSNPALRQKYINLAASVQKDLERQFKNGATMFIQYGYLSSLKNPDSNGAALSARQTLDKLYTDAVVRGGIDPKTGFPPPGQPPYDPTKPPPPPGPTSDPCCDNLLSLAQSSIVPQLLSIAAALQQLAAQSNGNATDNLDQDLRDIQAVLQGLERCVCTDLRQIVDAINRLAGNAPQDPADTALINLFVSRGTIEAPVGQLLTS